jgi:addiction module HigA family antidote
MAIKPNFQPSHVGDFLKRSVLPDDLSVTEAAEVLGVGRPALSQLLNGKAALSPEMALRFEKAFGVKMDTLLRMQARYEAWQMRARAAQIKVKPYNP